MKAKVTKARWSWMAAALGLGLLTNACGTDDGGGSTTDTDDQDARPREQVDEGPNVDSAIDEDDLGEAPDAADATVEPTTDMTAPPPDMAVVPEDAVVVPPDVWVSDEPTLTKTPSAAVTVRSVSRANPPFHFPSSRSGPDTTALYPTALFPLRAITVASDKPLTAPSTTYPLYPGSAAVPANAPSAARTCNAAKFNACSVATNRPVTATGVARLVVVPSPTAP
jgi:hypothetical protein